MNMVFYVDRSGALVSGVGIAVPVDAMTVSESRFAELRAEQEDRAAASHDAHADRIRAKADEKAAARASAGTAAARTVHAGLLDAGVPPETALLVAGLFDPTFQGG